MRDLSQDNRFLSVNTVQDAIDVRRRFTHGLQLINSIRNQPAARDVNFHNCEIRPSDARFFSPT
jgi:hypothetical protein